MSVTLTLTEQEPAVRTATLILRPRESYSEEKITTVVEGNLSNKGLEVEEEENSLDDWALVPYEPDERGRSVAELALTTISTPFVYTYYGACYFIDLFCYENLSFVVDLCTAKGVMGTVHSTVGACLGTFFGIRCAELISRRLIRKTVAVGCAYLGKSDLVRKFITAGANVIVAPSVEATIIILGGALGGEIAVIMGNVCYILAKKHKDVIAEWLSMRRAISES